MLGFTAIMKVALGLLVTLTLVLPWAAPRVVRGVREWPLDGLEGLRGGLGGEDTVYASGYSALAFQKIRIGSTRDEVRALLGPPLYGRKGIDFDYEIWSRSPGDTNFRRRTLEYSDDVVVEIVAEFYHD